jgi:hypothetical protein
MAAPQPALPDYMLKMINGELSEEQKQAHYDHGLQRWVAACGACGGHAAEAPKPTHPPPIQPSVCSLHASCLRHARPRPLPSCACLPASLLAPRRWWKEYAARKNDEEEEHVADSLLYDERCHLPRTTARPRFEGQQQQQLGQQEQQQQAGRQEQQPLAAAGVASGAAAAAAAAEVGAASRQQAHTDAAASAAH